MDIHDCTACVRKHFYDADYLRIVYTLPIEAYALHRQLQYRICDAWNRFEDSKQQLSERECVMLAAAWFMSVPEHTKPMYVNAAWRPACANCSEPLYFHQLHPENNPKNDPPDRWVCKDGRLYEAIQYPKPHYDEHPSDIEVNSRKR